jgi:Cu2+-containing amine oxidase
VAQHEWIKGRIRCARKFNILRNVSRQPVQIDSVVAIFEKFGPISSWQVYARYNLAVKYFTKISSYDYGFKWVFREDISITRPS